MEALHRFYRSEQGMPEGLPHLDQILDSTSGCDLLSFLVANSRYHQIFMSMEDEEKTVFITPCCTYCFVRMPFLLKSTGSTFESSPNWV